MFKKLLALAGIALVLFVAKLLVDAGAFRTITPHFAGKVLTIPKLEGAEDLEYSAARKVLFISSDFRPTTHGAPSPRGDIWALSVGSTTPTNLTSGLALDFEFHPHGMALFDFPDRTRLWVINHRADSDSIEVFDYAGGKLSLQKTIKGTLLKNANDVVAVDGARLYVTHDHGSASHLGGKLEDYARLGRGYVTFYDGSSFTVKADGIRFANGAIFSKDPVAPDARLLVASMLGKSIRVYARDAATNDLTFEREVPLESGPDNITRDASGTVWVGAHPKLLSLKAMNDNRSKRAPAQVLRIRDITGAAPVIDEVLMDDGAKIAAASVALFVEGHLYVGSVFDDRLLDCSL